MVLLDYYDIEVVNFICVYIFIQVHRKASLDSVTKAFAYDKQFLDLVCNIWKMVSPLMIGMLNYNYTLPSPWIEADCVNST